jgi:membrane associated rhomboid family serine protease
MNRRGFNLFRDLPAVTKNLIIINTLFWLATVIMIKLNLTEMLGLHYPGSGGFRLYQIITYMFMHGSLIHLFFNMFAVYMFGRLLESVWGSKRFLTYFMITGIGAGLINILVAYIRIKAAEVDLSPDAIAEIYRDGYDIIKQGMNYTDPAMGQLNRLINTATVGASGSVFGILLAIGMLFPNLSLYIIPIPFPVKAKYFVIGYAAIELFAGFAEIRGDNVAHFAHLGGMLFGLVLILYWRKREKDKYGGYFY